MNFRGRDRVAIARALVKTRKSFWRTAHRFLDSKTALRIFDILKKLSRKSWSWSSHDRSLRKCTGQVIELADGRIISDISKTTVQARLTQCQYAQNEG